MPNQINKTAQNFLENSQVIIESLEGTLLRLYVSYEQHDISDAKAKAMLEVCETLASAALEDIESASAKTILDISMIVNLATGILYTLEELAHLNLAKGHTAAAINGLTLACSSLNELLEVAVDYVMKGGSHNA